LKILCAMFLGLVVFPCVVGFGASGNSNQTLKDQNELLLRQLKEARGLTDEQVAAVRKIFEASGYIGQGNPALTRHPVTTAECMDKLKQQAVHYENARFEKICGGKYLAPLYDPATQKPEDAKACIDQFEFPDIPCDYPVVWVKAREAAQICWAVGERIADAHEWEGACEGDLQPPDYPFALARGLSPDAGIGRMRAAHNKADAPTKRWSYGPNTRRGSALRRAARLRGAMAEAGRGVVRIPFRPGTFRSATARWKSTTLTEMRRNI